MAGFWKPGQSTRRIEQTVCVEAEIALKKLYKKSFQIEKIILEVLSKVTKKRLQEQNFV